LGTTFGGGLSNIELLEQGAHRAHLPVVYQRDSPATQPTHAMCEPSRCLASYRCKKFFSERGRCTARNAATGANRSARASQRRARVQPASRFVMDTSPTGNYQMRVANRETHEFVHLSASSTSSAATNRHTLVIP
jgi:phosphoketolase